MTKDYIGTKRITAWSRDRENADGTVTPGMAVKYADGYISWSPLDAFNEAYQTITAMDFGHALFTLKRGERVARAGWNGKGMFLFLVAGSQFTVNREPLVSILGEGTLVNYNPHIDIKNVDGSISTWVPSIGDCMATDWMIVPAEAAEPPRGG
jgi:uncharacterized protein DUF2829